MPRHPPATRRQRHLHSVQQAALRPILALLMMSTLVACVAAPPRNPDNLCAIFLEKDGWYQDAKTATQRWGTPIAVQLAIIDQESGYRSDVKPPRTRLLWIIPWRRPSSAYGYTQALDSTWALYQKKSGQGGADRDDFGDSVDFVAWYVARSYKLLGLSKDDAYSNYLAYYTGWTGYRRGDYRNNSRLLRSARRVRARAARYTRQLAGCRKKLEERLNDSWFWFF